MVNSWSSAIRLNPHTPNQATTTTDCCSFEMIRASFQQEWAGQGCLRYTWTQRAPKPACTEGLLISVRSGVNARAVAAAHQSSRSACRRVPIGTRPVRPVHCTESVHCTDSDHTQHHWSPTESDCVSNDRRCATSHAANVPRAAARLAHERPIEASDPEEGRLGRNDSRCAGLGR